MTEVGQARGPQPTQVQGTQQATGTLGGVKVAVGQALSRVGEAFKSFGTAVSQFFTSLFSLNVRQEAVTQPRVGSQTDRPPQALVANETASGRLAREIASGLDVPSVVEQFDVPGRDDVTVSRIFARDLQGSGKNMTFGGEEIIPQHDVDGKPITYTQGEKVAMVTGLLTQRFGTDGANLVSQYAHQGTFASVDHVLYSMDTPIETSDGRKVFPQAGDRPFFIDISQDDDGAIRMTFTQEYRNIQMLMPIDPTDTAPPPTPKEGATVKTSFDIVLRDDGSGYQPHCGPLQVVSDLGV